MFVGFFKVFDLEPFFDILKAHCAETAADWDGAEEMSDEGEVEEDEVEVVLPQRPPGQVLENDTPVVEAMEDTYEANAVAQEADAQTLPQAVAVKSDAGIIPPNAKMIAEMKARAAELRPVVDIDDRIF